MARNAGIEQTEIVTVLVPPPGIACQLEILCKTDGKISPISSLGSKIFDQGWAVLDDLDISLHQEVDDDFNRCRAIVLGQLAHQLELFEIGSLPITTPL